MDRLIRKEVRDFGNDWLDAVTIAQGLYSDAELAVWLNAPQPLLEGWTPIQLLGCGRGDDLLRVMRSLEDGAFI